MVDQVRGLSSMATKQLLADLCVALQRDHAVTATFRSAGGVEMARQVREGVDADVVVLGASAMADLEAEGHLVRGTLRPLFLSEVVAAVPAGVSPPHLHTAEDLRAALLGAGRIAYSTGPSGTAVFALIESWGLLPLIRERLVQVPPGVPVGSLLAERQVDLGFQQLSELRIVPGVQVLGPLPETAAISSAFSGGVLTSSRQPANAGRALQLLAAPETHALVIAHGMSPLGFRGRA